MIMTIKRAADFSLSIVGDGLTNIVSITLATAQVFLSPPTEVSPSYSANSALDLNLNKPSDVMGVYSPTGGVPTIQNAAITGLGTALQVTFETAPPLNAPLTIAGKLVF